MDALFVLYSVQLDNKWEYCTLIIGVVSIQAILVQ